MLFVDRTPDKKKPGAKDAGPAGQGKGVTAFRWKKELVYDEQEKQIVMTGDVFITHEPQDSATASTKKSPGSFDLAAERVTAFVESDKVAQADGGAGSASTFRLQRIVAEGTVIFRREDLEFTAASVQYDERTHQLVARGSPTQPCQVQKGSMTGEFAQVDANTETEEVLFHAVSANGRGR
jgi:lipopolysaccharide assembly outer membrane protein LptD (OstA)